MFQDIPGSLKLWAHQHGALSFIIDHLRSNSDPCLVRMPTGTGKTGVVACLSLLSATGRTLVLTPWANLRDQMVEALRHGFWGSIGEVAPTKKVVSMLPSTAEDEIKTAASVLVCTFATLTELRRERPNIYAALAASIDVVFVDECHYEPALEWGKAVKGLKKPPVLLTATPYRNDLKLFRIRDTSRAVFQFTHEAAEAQGIIRPLNIQPLVSSADLASLSREFVAVWNRARSSGELVSSSPRAIICCASAADITVVVATLQSAGLDAIGIHENFDGLSKSGLIKDVPLLNTPATIWVHQNKLTEGLDDHRFCCLAFFCAVNNDRKLVQQIGRIIRKHKSDKQGREALLLAPVEFEIADRWDAYRAFEKDADMLSPERYREFVEGILNEQPDIEYFDGRFRRRFRTDELQRDPQVLIAPSVLVRAVGAGFKMAEYVEDCTDSLNLTDAIILGSPNEPCQQSQEHALWVYASIANSRLLTDTSLYEVRLEAHCAVLSNGYLFISDTTGTYPVAMLESYTTNLGAAEISRLLDATYRVTNVSVSSAVPFDTVLRASEHRGHDLSSIPTSLTDRIQICKSARGASSKGRRYLGLQRGRVRDELSERARRKHSAAVFKTWAEAISKELSAAAGSHPVLQRYMQAVRPPVSPVPVSVSIDLSNPKVEVTTAKGEDLLILASSVAVSPKTTGTALSFECVFSFQKNGDPTMLVELPVTVEFQVPKGRFWFKSSGPTGVLVFETDDALRAKRNLVDYLNQNQELVLIGLDGGELVYQGRSFYAIDYSHAETALLQRIRRAPHVFCKTEKGSKAEIAAAKTAKATTFVAGSLFKAIAEESIPLPFAPELIICDDLGSECADFVLANFAERQLALVHAKAGSGSGISASAFHDIVAQAMKNLAYLTRNASQPDGVGSWRYNARWNKTGIPRLYKTPAGCPRATALWKKLRDDIIDSAGGQLHVVLATTGCCDLGALENAVKDPSLRTAETAQLFHLLDGLVGYARQLGVRVSIVDVPYTP